MMGLASDIVKANESVYDAKIRWDGCVREYHLVQRHRRVLAFEGCRIHPPVAPQVVGPLLKKANHERRWWLEKVFLLRFAGETRWHKETMAFQDRTRVASSVKQTNPW